MTQDTETHRPLDDSLRRNIQLGAQVSSVLALIGPRAFDRYLLPQAEGLRISSLEGVLLHSLDARAVWLADPQRETVSLFRAASGFSSGCDLPSKPGDLRDMNVAAAVEALRRVHLQGPDQRVCLLVDAHLLLEDPGGPRAEDFAHVRAIERLARDRDPARLLALRVNRAADLPAAWKDSIFVRQINLPAAAREERHAYALQRLRGLELAGADGQPVPGEPWAQAVAASTEDWTLNEIENLLTVAREKGVNNLRELDDLATAMRLGTTATPWSGQLIRDAVGQAPQRLGERVLGQPQAVAELVDFLAEAYVGLTVHSRKSQAPRGVKLLAGPSGVGKTEAAKAMSELLFGQEQLLRFDCGEFQQEHALARLIGAPPGYVGHGTGGELTEGVRKKPNSVVLLDEIEKAAPRLWDGLLAVFDDGRMTDGQGQTTLFGQTIIVLTTNLGMHREELGPDGRPRRVPRFGYDTPYEDLKREMRRAIQDELNGKLGRPELLGRLGGPQNIVIFDFLRDPLGVARKFARNMAEDIHARHGAAVEFSEDLLQLCAQRFLANQEELILGARALAKELKTLAGAPLARHLVCNEVRGRTLRLVLRGDGVVVQAG